MRERERVRRERERMCVCPQASNQMADAAKGKVISGIKGFFIVSSDVRKVVSIFFSLLILMNWLGRARVNPIKVISFKRVKLVLN